MTIEKAIYTARAKAMGGRVGIAKSDDGQISLKLDRPVEMGGKGNGTNPEQLFAAGYAACFIGALRVVAGKSHIRIPEDVAIDSAVSFGPLKGEAEGFGIAVAMTIHLLGIERAPPGNWCIAPTKYARIPMQPEAISTCTDCCLEAAEP
jgi:lipoyl-dependent peroxiredoxin